MTDTRPRLAISDEPPINAPVGSPGPTHSLAAYEQTADRAAMSRPSSRRLALVPSGLPTSPSDDRINLLDAKAPSRNDTYRPVNKLPEPQHMKDIGFTTFGLAMPDELKDYDNPIQSYRNYYMLDKGTFAEWKYRNKPEWWDEELADYENRITRK